MATVDENSIISVEQEAWKSHEMLFTFSVLNFPPIHSLEFMKVWQTECSPTPTKWKIIVKFIKTGPPKYFACVLTVKRIDIKERTVNVSCCMDMFNNSMESVVDTRGFPPTDADSGQEFKEVFDPVLSNKAIEKLPGHVLNVRVRLCVTCCHEPRRRVSRTVGFNLDDSQSSMEKIEIEYV